MTIEFNCPECGKQLKTSDDKAGVQAKCPGCSASVMVPDSASPGGDGGENYQFGTGENAYGTEGQQSPGYGTPPQQAPGGGYGGQQPYAGAGQQPYGGSQYGAPPQYGSAPGGAPYGGGYGQPGGYLKPHRGGMLLAFALLGWFVCMIFSIVAWVMANNDLKEIRAGTMDPAGEGLTNASRIIAMIHCILVAVILVFYCVLIIIGAAAGGLQ